MKKKLAGILLAIAMMLGAMGTVGAFAETSNAQFTYKPFPAMQEEHWSMFAWSAGETVTMEKEISDQNSIDDQPSLKVVKTVNSADGQANVYYQNFGALAASLSNETPYGVRFWVYSEKSIESGNGLGFLFDGKEQTAVTCQDKDSDKILKTRSLDYVGFRQFTVAFPENVENVANVGQFQIMVWGNTSGTLYYSGFEMIYGEKSEEPEKEQVTTPAELGDHSMQISGFNNEDELGLWGLSGQSGSLYKTELNTDAQYVKEGAGSIKYTWDNQTYGDAWTEIYFNITDIIQKNKESDLTGITFWIYNTQEFERDDAVWWLKIAEADGSEYSADSLEFASTTNLDFTGWKKMEVPFSAVTELQTYSQDENDQLDVDQIAYIKIGIRNKAKNNGFYNSVIYIDDVQLTANKPFAGAVTPGGDDGKDDKTESGCGGSIAVSAVSVVLCALTLAATVILIGKRAKNNK